MSDADDDSIWLQKKFRKSAGFLTPVPTIHPPAHVMIIVVVVVIAHLGLKTKGKLPKAEIKY